MKKIALYLFGALALAACNNGYKIEGTTDKIFEGLNAQLINVNTRDTLGECIIKNNSFSFEGNIAEPEVFKVKIEYFNKDFVVEPNSNIEIDLTTPQVKVKDNGGLNDKAYSIDQELENRTTELHSQYNELVKKVKDGELQEDTLYHFGNYILGELKTIYKKSIADNKDNILGAHLLSTYAIRKKLYNDLESLDSVMQAVKYSGKMQALKFLREDLEREKANNK